LFLQFARVVCLRLDCRLANLEASSLVTVMLACSRNRVVPDLGCLWHPKGRFVCALMSTELI